MKPDEKYEWIPWYLLLKQDMAAGWITSRKLRASEGEEMGEEYRKQKNEVQQGVNWGF